MLLSWIETALSFFCSNSSKYYFHLYILFANTFHEAYLFFIIDEAMTHPYKGAITKLQIEKSIYLKSNV